MDKKEIASAIDHTLLGAEVTKAGLKEKCTEAKEYAFASVCSNPDQVALMKEELNGSEVKVCTVIGFPLGVNSTAVKAAEVRKAVAEGADELDMVMKIGALKEGDFKTVQKDIEAVVEAAAGKTVKVIIETCYLNDEQKITACQLAKKAGADFVITRNTKDFAGSTLKVCDPNEFLALLDR